MPKTSRKKAQYATRRAKKQSLLASLEEQLEKIPDDTQDPELVLLRESTLDDIEKLKNELHKHNARAVEWNGIKFPSTLERDFYIMLTDAGIPFLYQMDMPLQPSFWCQGDKIQKIDARIDFLIDNRFIVDTKGMFTEKSKIKWKLLKYKYKDNYEYFTPRNNKECTNLLLYIKERLNAVR